MSRTKEIEDFLCDSEHYCETYRDLAFVIGEEETRKVWQTYRGLTIHYPQKLYSPEFAKAFIMTYKDRMKIKDNAASLNLTDRRVRQLIKEMQDMHYEIPN